jgi:hypothetical protein
VRKVVVFTTSLKDAPTLTRAKFGAPRGSGFDKFTVAAFDGPSVMVGEKLTERRRDGISRALDRNLPRLPHDGVEVQMRQSVRRCERACKGRLTDPALPKTRIRMVLDQPAPNSPASAAGDQRVVPNSTFR